MTRRRKRSTFRARGRGLAYAPIPLGRLAFLGSGWWF